MPGARTAHRAWTFGEFTLDLDRGSLLRGGAEVRLRPKSYAVLTYLIEHHGRLVPKQELLNAIWGHAVVTEGVLTKCLIDIRRALGDESQQIIRTVPRRGYLFDVAVEEGAGDQPPSGDEAVAAQPLAPPGRAGAVFQAGLAVAPILAVFIGYLLIDQRIDDGDQAGAAPPRASIAALPQLLEIERLRNIGENGVAFQLATEIERLLPDEAARERLWAGISWTWDIESDPVGARVFRQPVSAADDEWEDLGTTPIKAVRFARGVGYRMRFELEGHRPVELLQAASLQLIRRTEERRPVKLDPVDTLPEEMVRIPGFTHGPVEYDDFFMDRYEVTNREFARFVAFGGYESPEYWTQPFVGEGAEVPWQEAVKGFVDQTGRPGPASWIGGAYPDDQGDYPVSGVSWYEAAAYAEYMEKQLPTIFHIARAQADYAVDGGFVAPRSNLGGDGPRPVGYNRAMNSLGIYDLVGNVREWCWNRSGGGARRGTAGAAWTDAPFHIGWIIPKSPWDRHPTHGFRLIRTFDAEEELVRLRQPENPLPRRDLRHEEPPSDEEFRIYRRMYAYDPLPLNAEVVAIDTFEHWTRERVEFDLPYGERGGAYVYVPSRAEPPFKPVLYWGGAMQLTFQSVDEDFLDAFNFIIRSGRLVAGPIFKGTFDRDDDNCCLGIGDAWGDSFLETGATWRDFQIKWVQELSRTIDYLETREDVDSSSFGFYGLSWGSGVAPIVLAVEDRIGPAVLNVGGLEDLVHHLPEADPFTFVGRVHNPVLMLNGKYDIVFPYETSQRPMFEMLGTAPAHKKHFVTSTGHIVPRDALIRETLEWFDRYLDERDY